MVALRDVLPDRLDGHRLWGREVRYPGTGPRAWRWRTARGPAPVEPGTAAGGALAACAAVCVAVIAAVMASRDGTVRARPSPAGYIWPWRTGPAGS